VEMIFEYSEKVMLDCVLFSGIVRLVRSSLVVILSACHGS